MAITLVLGSATLLAQARPQPGVRLPLPQIEAQMFHVSAGKRLKPAAPFDERNAEISPDGHWMAYESNESGQSQIYVRPFPNVTDGT